MDTAPLENPAEPLGELPVPISSGPAIPRSFYVRRGKHIFDVCVVLALSPVWLPLYLALAVLILVTEGRPIHYRATRVGRDGRHFEIVKFRTMARDADERLVRLLEEHPELADEYETSVKLRQDPRITKRGYWLRKASLDELPQLFNVLIGQMSLVGPRPVTEGEWDRFYGSLAHPVFGMLPGLTGMWQVSRRHPLPYERRIWLDLLYARKCSLKKDLRILWRTIPTVVRGHGAY